MKREDLTDEQLRFLYNCSNKNWTINYKTGLVDVIGKCDCSNMGLKHFHGVEFGLVTGDFDCSKNGLTSLAGGPRDVRSDFKCYANNLENLVGSPSKVGGSFTFDLRVNLKGMRYKGISGDVLYQDRNLIQSFSEKLRHMSIPIGISFSRYFEIMIKQVYR